MDDLCPNKLDAGAPAFDNPTYETPGCGPAKAFGAFAVVVDVLGADCPMFPNRLDVGCCTCACDAVDCPNNEGVDCCCGCCGCPNKEVDGCENKEGAVID